MLDYLTYIRISRLKFNDMNGFIEERHNLKLLHVKWSNFHNNSVKLSDLDLLCFQRAS